MYRERDERERDWPSKRNVSMVFTEKNPFMTGLNMLFCEHKYAKHLLSDSVLAASLDRCSEDCGMALPATRSIVVDWSAQKRVHQNDDARVGSAAQGNAIS